VNNIDLKNKKNSSTLLFKPKKIKDLLISTEATNTTSDDDDDDDEEDVNSEQNKIKLKQNDIELNLK